MIHEARIPEEGEVHSVVTIGDHSFRLVYGYCDERDRSTGEPYILYPDLLSEPAYTDDGYRIVAALQSICPHYKAPEGREKENCCYTCVHYPDQKEEIGICGCERMRLQPFVPRREEV